jgi:hypothetical protein
MKIKSKQTGKDVRELEILRGSLKIKCSSSNCVLLHISHTNA